MISQGRKPTAVVITEKPAIDEAAVAADLQMADQGHLAALRKVQDSALDVGRLAGRIESMIFQRSVADRVIAEAFIQLRESKKYKDLLIDDENGNRRPVADLEEACLFLFGKSNRTCRELAQNYESLGAELYDKAQQIGLHTKDYRAIRALPSDDQALVQQAIESASDREAVTELLMELSERHARKVLQLQEDNAAKDQVIAQGKEHIAKLVEDKNRRERLTEAERQAELERALTDATLVACGDLLVIAGCIRDIRALDRLPQGLYVACANALQRVVSEAMGIAVDYGIELTLAAELATGDEALLDDPNAGEDPSADWAEQGE